MLDAHENIFHLSKSPSSERREGLALTGVDSVSTMVVRHSGQSAIL